MKRDDKEDRAAAALYLMLAIGILAGAIAAGIFITLITQPK